MRLVKAVIRPWSTLRFVVGKVGGRPAGRGARHRRGSNVAAAGAGFVDVTRQSLEPREPLGLLGNKLAPWGEFVSGAI
ncbi:hypothetical protein [Rhodococcus sp. NPDC057529]|uniref:hypothetical protein n=1 Tax=Rhodococcus sp. NPDC057529 TaxID=3346158 RepID=UPI0036712594